MNIVKGVFIFRNLAISQYVMDTLMNFKFTVFNRIKYKCIYIVYTTLLMNKIINLPIIFQTKQYRHPPRAQFSESRILQVYFFSYLERSLE